MIYKTQIEQHKLHSKLEMNSGATEG
jgi:hypothetical protein